MNSRLVANGAGSRCLSSRQPTGLRVPRAIGAQRTRRVVSMKTGMEFIRGVEEPCVPDVRLTRSKDGSNGTAFFTFQNPNVFEASSEMGDITGLYLVDDEGVLNTVNVQAKFINGKPDKIEAQYTMKSAFEWDRFMRFMERYADEHDLGFTKSS
ncbi:hypothetical protein BSKO_11102 [Bryopsis sp. KO-2023]|nr:hypothetical protein BSKO_11102 [Bryopsis sp. KO-2023]